MFEPKVLAFCCNWCSYAGADLAGVSRTQYAHNARIIRTMCSGRIEPRFVLEGFLHKADGVLVLGCHLGDCHYTTGNYQAMNRMKVTRKLLEYAGIDSRRLALDWVSASEGSRFAELITGFVKQVKQLGPLGSVEEMSARELELALKAARAATETERLRWVTSKQAEFTDKGNIYGEVFTEHEINRMLEGVVADEVNVSKITLLLQEGPLSVKELAARTGLSPRSVLRYIAMLRRKQQVDLHSVRETSPLYVARAGGQ
ncbi:MAG: hydrogenase iron-sulfur subunit [Chloroflexi bacterium]|nr:hydrogenase iron-sulfur subunit [Chloroflexota bacterium]